MKRTQNGTDATPKARKVARVYSSSKKMRGMENMENMENCCPNGNVQIMDLANAAPAGGYMPIAMRKMTEFFDMDDTSPRHPKKEVRIMNDSPPMRGIRWAMQEVPNAKIMADLTPCRQTKARKYEKSNDWAELDDLYDQDWSTLV